MTRRAIVWFRRDLRLSDNPTLRAALDDAEEIIPLFVVDDRLWQPAGTNRLWYLLGCLEALDRELDGRLVIRHGAPAPIIRSLAADHEVGSVYHAGDVGPYGRERDTAVANSLAQDGREVVVVDTPWAVDPGRVTTKARDMYKVFTPFFRAWLDHGHDDPIPRPRRIDTVAGVASDGFPDRPRVDASLPEPGEPAARDRADRFLRSAVDHYHERRDVPGLDATSRLSADLKYGCLHPRQLLGRLDLRKPGHKTFAQELAWRDFYAHVLHRWPESAWAAWNDKLADIELDTGDAADRAFDAWCRGETGYPFIDAGMRQLQHEGWMHNRVRMATASFLIKDLHIDWTRGAAWFLRHLVDGDLSSNNHGWQWAAGTGTDAAPYFRIFNPVTQSERFDPDGTYIKRWVPELADVDPAHIHEPWKRDGGPPSGYPGPIVDHDHERKEALRRYERAKS